MEFRPTANRMYSRNKLKGMVAFAILILAGCLVALSLQYNLWGPRPTFKNVPAIMAHPPCAANVCIGDVGRQAVKAELSRNDLVVGIRDNGGDSIEFDIEEGGLGAVIFSQESGVDDRVELIEMHLTGMPLGKALSVLGEPEELFLMFGCGHGVHIHGKLFYPDEGIEVQVQYPSKMSNRSTPVVLDEESPILWAWYFDPTTYDEWLLNIDEALRFRNGYFSLPRTTTAEMLADAVQPWPGLGVPAQPNDLCPR